MNTVEKKPYLIGWDSQERLSDYKCIDEDLDEEILVEITRMKDAGYRVQVVLYTESEIRDIHNEIVVYEVDKMITEVEALSDIIASNRKYADELKKTTEYP